MKLKGIVMTGPYKGQQYVLTSIETGTSHWRWVLLIDENNHHALREVREECLEN